MTFWLCTLITIAGALSASFASDVRRAVLSLWIAGLGLGGLYLMMGAELLAMIQWIISTLVSIAFIFHSVLFGEYGGSAPAPASKAARAQKLVTSCLAGLAFGAVIWFATRDLALETGMPEGFQGAGDLFSLGKAISEQHMLAFEIFGLTLFLVVIGAGVIARPEDGKSQKGAKG